MFRQVNQPLVDGYPLQENGIMQAIPELLDEAERRAGRECDKLSVIALTWE